MGYTGLKMTGVVDGGSVVDLGVTAQTYDFNRFTSIPPIPQAQGGGSVFEVDTHGNANPNVIVEGQYFMNVETNPQGSVMISHARLGSFCRIGSTCTLTDDAYGTDVFTGVGSLIVIPRSFREQRDVTSNETGSQIIRYQLTLQQTKEWS